MVMHLALWRRLMWKARDFILLSYERPCVSCNFFGGISISNALCSSGIIRALQNWRVIVQQEFGAHFKGPLAPLEKRNGLFFAYIGVGTKNWCQNYFMLRITWGISYREFLWKTEIYFKTKLCRNGTLKYLSR